MYDPILVQPFRDEATSIGMKEIRSAEEIAAELSAAGTTLMFVNSVCGCAAGGARPALTKALAHSKLPARKYSVFAGQDLDATARARSYFGEYQPSSPSIALLKDGEVVAFVHRHEIEGRSPDQIAANLVSAFDAYCE